MGGEGGKEGSKEGGKQDEEYDCGWELSNTQTTTWVTNKYVWAQHTGIQMLIASHTTLNVFSKTLADTPVFKALFLLCSQLLHLWPSILLNRFPIIALIDMKCLLRLNSATLMKGNPGMPGKQHIWRKAHCTRKKRIPFRSALGPLHHAASQFFWKTILAPGHLPQWLVFIK